MAAYHDTQELLAHMTLTHGCAWQINSAESRFGRLPLLSSLLPPQQLTAATHRSSSPQHPTVADETRHCATVARAYPLILLSLYKYRRLLKLLFSVLFFFSLPLILALSSFCPHLSVSYSALVLLFRARPHHDVLKMTPLKAIASCKPQSTDWVPSKGHFFCTLCEVEVSWS